LEQGPGRGQSVGVIEPAVALSSYWFHKTQRPTVVINQNLPANYRLVVNATDAVTNAKLAVSWNNAARQLDGLPGAGTYHIEHYWQKYGPDGITVLDTGMRKTETLTIVDGPNQSISAAGYIFGTMRVDDDGYDIGRDYSSDWYSLQVQMPGLLNLFTGALTAPDGSSRSSLWYEFTSPNGELIDEGRDLESMSFTGYVLPGVYQLRVGAYDDGGYQLTGIVTSSVPPPLVSNTELPAGVLGVAYPTNVKLVTVPAATAYRAGGLPLGLTCDSRTGQIYGTPLQAGTFEVMLWADNAGAAGDSKILTLTVAKGSQAITFAAPANKLSTDAPFDLGATASSGLPVSVAVVSGPASVSGTVVSLTGLGGAVVVRVSQPGTTNYHPAAEVERSFTVALVPLVFAAEQITDSRFLASWAPVPGATGYRLDVSTNAGFSNLVLSNYSPVYLFNGASSIATSHTVSGLSANTNYW
ncbi:MAG: Ig domain-containing protein, partial [Rhodoglobus sp.]|nr:Ig domain-containing protein [Rhodoglobus sp.]